MIGTKIKFLNSNIEVLVQDIFSMREKGEQEVLARTDQMLHLIRGKACFSKFLARHFGDDFPDGKLECEHFTWRLNHVDCCSTQSPSCTIQ
jgi:hypothetical protein